MNIELSEFVEVNETYVFSKEELVGTDLIEIKDLLVKGNISNYNDDDYHINLNIKGTMVLPCSLTLKPTDYSFETDVDGDLEEILTEIDENHGNIRNNVDILPIIWENILMEIPLKVICDEKLEVTEGEGWSFVSDSESKPNPELEKLNELLDSEV